MAKKCKYKYKVAVRQHGLIEELFILTLFRKRRWIPFAPWLVDTGPDRYRVVPKDQASQIQTIINEMIGNAKKRKQP